MRQDKTNCNRALVVEDEPVISLICQRTLMAMGFYVDVAANGLEAKKMVNDTKYDLCLSDIRTPAMNGIEFYEYLENKHADLAGKVIFMTGDVMSHSVNTFLKEINRPFLPKPFTPDELKGVVEEALKQLVDS